MVIIPPEWTAQSPCTQTDPDLFHPEHGGSNKKAAKRLCWDVCTVREQCLESALSWESGEQGPVAGVFGIWGGLIPSERRALLKERALGAAS